MNDRNVTKENASIMESPEGSDPAQSLKGRENSTPLVHDFNPVVIEWDNTKQDTYEGSDFVDWVAIHQLTGSDKKNYCFSRNSKLGQIRITSGEQAITQGPPIIIYWEGKPLSEINDKRRYYLDSSIWIRYADSRERLGEIKAELQQYAKLYKTNNAIEIKEFKARMVLNSFLLELGDHSQYVVPFVFHSEAEMKRITDNPQSGVKYRIWHHPNAQKLEWRMLIVDDNAFVREQTNTKSVNKCSVIASILNRDFTVYCDNIDKQERKKCNCSDKADKCPYQKDISTPRNTNLFYPNIYIDCARTISEAEVKVKHRRYDIILLDYLFKEKGGEKEEFKEYGTELLRTLKKQYEDNIHQNDLLLKENDDLELYKQTKGPFGKFWVFFISAFSNAISEKMLSEGMHYNTDYWHIARGACPTTTPELFRYNLYSLLYQQIKDITNVSAVKTDNSFSKIDKRVITLIDLLHYIFADQVSTRDLAMKNFNSLLHLRAHYDILKNDYYMGGKDKPGAEKNGSPLVQSLFPDLKYYNNAFWEHIQHLIYLIAFGNIRQWNEMWDEYIFIKDVLWEAEGKQAGEDNIVRKIEEYIIEIKNANYR